MKKIITAAGIASLLFMASAVFAATVKNVSDSSTATIVNSWLVSLVMTNNNNANIANSVHSTSNSGGNTIVSVDDQEGTVLTTGDSESATLTENNANNNLISEEIESSSGTSDTIEDVSDSSTGTVTTSDTLDNDIKNNNDVKVDNDVTADADTGSNTITSGDSLKGTHAITGIAGSATGVSNMFNLNIKDIKRKIVLPH